MSKQVDANKTRGKRRLLITLLVIALLLGAASWLAYRQFQKDTQVTIKNAPGSTRELVIPNAETKKFDDPLFSFDAPGDWKLVKHETAPYDLYSYKSTLTNADNRYMDIYVDRLPGTMAVNKALSVKAVGDALQHGQISENCTGFTPGAKATVGGPRQMSIPSKWDGVEFLCDNDNIMRNVVGTGATGSINKVTLTGKTTGPHSFFFVYIDNNATPEYTIFYKVLESFRLK
ncbi:MAG TPA: hypothetical protein VF572_06195 [Candidatus Saccharimonadales bacterium]|jgi:hypothetical protein